MVYQKQPAEKQVSGKRMSKLFIYFIAFGIVAYWVISYQNSFQREEKKRNSDYAVERQKSQRASEAVANANEYWGKNRDVWEASIRWPSSRKGRRGELGLTPYYYPSLGITVIVDDDNMIIKVEEGNP